MSNHIRFAIIGYGHIGKRYAEIIDKNKEAELVAIIDSAPHIDYVYNVPCFFSLEEFFAAKIKVDVINIASPNGHHFNHALKALDANIHILVEKPLALQVADANCIIKRAIEQNKLVFTVAQNRYAAVSIWLKNLIESGAFGKIFLVQANCFWNRDLRYYHTNTWRGTLDLDGGTLYTQFFHLIDMIYWLFGNIKNISLRFADFNHQQLTEFEDSGLIIFDFENGGIGNINYSTAVWNQNMESSITIIAEKGSVKVGGQYMDKIEYCHIKDYNLSDHTLDMIKTNSNQNHSRIIDNIIGVLKGREKADSLVYDAVKVIDIISRIYSFKS